MTTPYLHGNGKHCPKCNSSGRQFPGLCRELFPCKTCKGSGHKPRSPKKIAAQTAAEARRTYWPQFTERKPHV